MDFDIAIGKIRNKVQLTPIHCVPNLPASVVVVVGVVVGGVVGVVVGLVVGVVVGAVVGNEMCNRISLKLYNRQHRNFGSNNRVDPC